MKDVAYTSDDDYYVSSFMLEINSF